MFGSLYKVEHILLAFGGSVALNVQLVLLVGGVLTIGVCFSRDAVVGAELTTATVTTCRRNEGAAGRSWYDARLSQACKASSATVEGEELGGRSHDCDYARGVGIGRGW